MWVYRATTQRAASSGVASAQSATTCDCSGAQRTEHAKPPMIATAIICTTPETPALRLYPGLSHAQPFDQFVWVCHFVRQERGCCVDLEIVDQDGGATPAGIVCRYHAMLCHSLSRSVICHLSSAQTRGELAKLGCRLRRSAFHQCVIIARS